MFGYFFLFSKLPKKHWSSEQGRFVPRSVHLAEVNAEATRRCAIEDTVDRRLGWEPPCRGCFDFELGHSLPDGTWMPK